MGSVKPSAENLNQLQTIVLHLLQPPGKHETCPVTTDRFPVKPIGEMKHILHQMEVLQAFLQHTCNQWFGFDFLG